MTEPTETPRGIRAVLFDAVGTLFHSDPPITRVYAETGRRWGAMLDEAEVAARFTPAFLRHFGRAGRGSPAALTVSSEWLERDRWRRVVADVFVEIPDAGEGLFQSLWDHFARGANWRLFPDVVPTWRALRSRGLPLGIASNYDGRLLSVLRELPPLDECRHVFHSARLGHSKPGRGFFQAIEAEMGLRPDELLFVGDDRTNDYHGALDAGWRALWIVRTGGAEEGGQIRSLAEVLDHV